MRCCGVSSKEKGWWEIGLEQGRKEEFTEICTGLCWSRKSPQTPPNLNCPVSSQKMKDVLRCPSGRCNSDIYQPPISDPQEGAPHSIFTCTTEKSSYRLQVKLKHLNEVRRESNQPRRGQNDPNKRTQQRERSGCWSSSAKLYPPSPHACRTKHIQTPKLHKS